mgnify:CR=1 FL=1
MEDRTDSESRRLALNRTGEVKVGGTARALPPVGPAGARGVWRGLWDLVGVPFRLVLFPDDWNERLGWTSLEQSRIRAVLPEVRGRLLDVGAGRNRLVRSYGSEGIGVDVHDFGFGARIIQDSRQLPFPDRSFDTVTFVACLNHLPYREQALREAWRVLRPGGRVVATMISRWLGELGHRLWWYSEDKHRRVAEGESGGLDPAEMRQLLAQNGFTAIRRRRFCCGLNSLYVAEKPGEHAPQFSLPHAPSAVAVQDGSTRHAPWH